MLFHRPLKPFNFNFFLIITSWFFLSAQISHSPNIHSLDLKSQTKSEVMSFKLSFSWRNPCDFNVSTKNCIFECFTQTHVSQFLILGGKTVCIFWNYFYLSQPYTFGGDFSVYLVDILFGELLFCMFYTPCYRLSHTLRRLCSKILYFIL